MTTDYAGLKVIIADGECQLERQRRIRPVDRRKTFIGASESCASKYGVDEDTCTGDHSCIRLSGCPTLTVKDNPDPLRRDPVATVIDGCVGCGLCGENAHAAVLCPSFYRAEVVQNPIVFDRILDRMRRGSSPHEPALNAPLTHPDRRAGRRRRRRHGRLADRTRRPQCGFPAQSTSIPGVCAAHRRDYLLPEIFPARQ